MAVVRNPKWTADDALAYPIVVSRGEPRRNHEQMYDAVRKQVSGYFAALGSPVSDELAHLVTAAIALEQIYREGAQGVVVTRESVKVYLKMAQAAR